MTTTLLLIRHGSNDLLKERRMGGRMPGIHLNEQGRAEAKALTRRLARTRLAAVYSSPLERAVETAQINRRGRYPTYGVGVQLNAHTAWFFITNSTN